MAIVAREIKRFAHSTIYLTERGVEILRDDGEILPPAPTEEKAQEARAAIAEALVTLSGNRKEYLDREILTLDYLWGLKGAMEDILQDAFAALDTPARDSLDRISKNS